MKTIFRILKKIFGFFHFSVSDKGVVIQPKSSTQNDFLLNAGKNVRVHRKVIQLKYLKDAEPDRTTTFRVAVAPLDQEVGDPFVIFVNNVKVGSGIPIAEMVADMFAEKSNADAYEFRE